MHFRGKPEFQPHTSAVGTAGSDRVTPSVGPRLTLEWLSLLTATLTVCALPWLLGGAIPKARLVLQVGTVAAAILTLLARLTARRSFAMPPLGTWVLLGLAAIGIVQLQPWMPSAISLMNHAVHPEFRSDIPQVSVGSDTSRMSNKSAADSRSVAPVLTRRQVAQWIAVAVLLCVVADSLSQPRQLVCMLGLLCLNACVLTILSLLQLFDSGGNRWLSEPWIISNTTPFGSFVNPNNASGWLLVHVGMAVGLLLIILGNNPASGWSPSFGPATWRDRFFDAAMILRHRVARLDTFQILSMVMVVLLLTGVAATLSRAGIVAGIFCLVACAASRMQWRKSLLLLAPVAILLLVANGILTAFELDTLVVAELSTLKDPVSESTGRMLHWSDSMVSVRDFPFIGSGQGAYAYSTLPYQRRGSSTWFMNADNQYVEILIESGLLGLALFAGFGILLTVIAMQLILKKSDKRAESGLPAHRIAIGLAGIAMLASQAIAAFFDYGIGLPSTMAAIAVFGGVLTAVHQSQLSAKRTHSAKVGFDNVAVPWILRVALVAAACSSIPELRQADQGYPAIVQTARILGNPVTRETLQQLPKLQEELTASLKHHPDDPLVLRSLVRVMEAGYRLEVIDDLTASDTPVNDLQLQSLWSVLTPLGLADRYAMLRNRPDSQQFRMIQATLKAVSDKFPWRNLAREAARRTPLNPGLAVDAAAGSMILKRLEESQLDELNAVRFSAPADARRLYQSGLVCLIANHPEQTQGFWRQSLAASENFRMQILTDALRHWTLEQSLSLFAPEEFAETVRTAFSASSPELQEGLWQIAGAQWAVVAAAPAVDQRIQRAVYLARRESNDVALAWIDECLVELPSNLTLRQMRAETLEKQGEVTEAISEWMRYEHFDPESSLPAVSIKRLSDARFK